MALPHTGASGGLVRNIARPETGRADVREGSPRHRHENMFCNSRPCPGLGVALRQEEKGGETCERTSEPGSSSAIRHGLQAKAFSVQFP